MTPLLRATPVLLLLAACREPGPAAPTFDRPEIEALLTADRLELVSLDPGLSDVGPWREIGRATITDPAVRHDLAVALNDALRPDAPRARCFYPRHRLRTTVGETTHDIDICLQCVTVDLGGTWMSIKRDLLEPVLEREREAAGLPLAP